MKWSNISVIILLAAVAIYKCQAGTDEFGREITPLFAVNALLNSATGEITTIRILLADDVYRVHLTTMEPPSYCFNAIAYSDKNVSNAKDVPTEYPYIPEHNSLPKPVERRAVKLCKGEGIGNVIYFSETVLSGGALGCFGPDYNTFEILPSALIYLADEKGKFISKIDVPTQTRGFKICSGFLREPNIMYLYDMKPPKPVADEAPVRVRGVMDMNDGRLTLLVQARGKPLHVHMKSVEHLRTAFKIEAFDENGHEIPLQSKFLNRDVSPQVDIPPLERVVDLHPNEAITNTCSFSEMPFWNNLDENVATKIKKIALTPTSKVYTADEVGHPVEYNGKVEFEPLVIKNEKAIDCFYATESRVIENVGQAFEFNDEDLPVIIVKQGMLTKLIEMSRKKSLLQNSLIQQ